jgi:hypothetical protein
MLKYPMNDEADIYSADSRVRHRDSREVVSPKTSVAGANSYAGNRRANDGRARALGIPIGA